MQYSLKSLSQQRLAKRFSQVSGSSSSSQMNFISSLITSMSLLSFELVNLFVFQDNLFNQSYRHNVSEALRVALEHFFQTLAFAIIKQIVVDQFFVLGISVHAHELLKPDLSFKPSIFKGFQSKHIFLSLKLNASTCFAHL